MNQGRELGVTVHYKITPQLQPQLQFLTGKNGIFHYSVCA